jgi:VanZ family protein
MWFSRLLFVLGCLGTIAITVLSLVPIEARPHVLEVSQLEHVDAYFATGLVFALASRTRRGLILTGVSLSVLAGLLEIAQIWIPGRNPRLIDWAAGALGVSAGITATLLLLWLLRPRGA